MAQNYSDPKRATDAYSLPDVETFRANYAYCSECQSLILDADNYITQPGEPRLTHKGKCQDCGTINTLGKAGWFYWFCFPGCLPDSEPFGPYKSESAALRDAQENSDADDPEVE